MNAIKEKMVENNTVSGVELDEDTIKNMVELVSTVKMLEGYMNDQVIKDIAVIISSMSKLVNAATSTDLIDVMERAVQDPELDKVLVNPEKGSLFEVLKKLNDKDVQRGMFIMLELLRAIGKASKE